MAKSLPDNDGINKALNAVRGLRNPPGITGRAAQMRYSGNDPALQEAFLRGLLGIPDNVTVIVINQGAVPELPPEPEPPMTMAQQKRLANLAKAQAARRLNLEAKKAKEEALQAQRLKALRKARRVQKKKRAS